ncbi:hypothetical protein [Natronobeatus ordinarius]|uniref:hypothetical protein n=1 Tax=Natronobeatus ordinarius TaxID=2963433 RepID=UPI0020CE9BC2|nr:hypothetical protein [Natronobeatus ordinarius]
MQEYPRRTLLGGIGATITAALAGHAVAADGDREQSPDAVEVPADGPDFSSLLEFLPASVATDSMQLTVADVERLLEADEPYGPHVPIGPVRTDPEDVSKVASVVATDEGYSTPITVVEGDVEFDGEPESNETDDGVTYDLYEHGARRGETTYAAVTDDVAIVTTEKATIDDAFAASADDTDRLLDAAPRLAAGIEAYEYADSRHVSVEEELHLPFDLDDGDVNFAAYASTVIDPDTIRVDLGVDFEDEAAITDEVLEAIETEFAYMPTRDEPEAEVDGTLVTVTIVRDLAAERAVREHDSPGFLRVNDRDIDLEDDYLEIELGRGDPTPVEDLTFEVGDEAYDREIWAGDAKKLEEGDTIRLDMDDVEPNLQVRLRHEHELGSSGSGTTILNHFRFRFEYDYDAETVAVEYDDEFPLDGDRLWLAAHDRDSMYGPRGPDAEEPEPRATRQPWDGELSAGDDATLDGVLPGDEVIVGWDGDTRRDSIARHRVSPPGTARFEYDYDSRTVTATLELEDERPAEKYELRVDDEPADTQWADEADTVTDGATLELEDVEVGSRLEVVWSETDARVGGYRIAPPGGATFEYDYDSKTLSATLELEDDVERAAEKYELWVNHEPVAGWADDHDTVTDGATLEVTDVELGSYVTLVWSDTEDHIDWYHVRPPGTATVEYDYETETTTVTLELENEVERAAEKYELELGREPADTQWADEYDTVTDGATLELEDVELGSYVNVVWSETGGRVGGGRVAPEIDLELRADEGEFEHVGGDELPTPKLEAELRSGRSRETIDLEPEVGDTFEEGDVVAFDAEDVSEVVVVYGGGHWVGADWQRE